MTDNRLIDGRDKVMLTANDGACFEVRRLRRGDAAALQDFNRHLDADRVRFNPHAYDEKTLDLLLRRSEQGEDLVLGLFQPTGSGASDRQENPPAVQHQRLAGYFFLWYFRARVPLLGIGLLPACQGRGLGRQMVDLLTRQARLAGREGVELTTLPDNDQAFALYRKCGFHYFGDVENRDGNGRMVIERAMFYEIKPGARTMDTPHGPPV